MTEGSAVKKRFIPILLAALLAFSLMPTAAYADDVAQGVTVPTNGGIIDTNSGTVTANESGGTVANNN